MRGEVAEEVRAAARDGSAPVAGVLVKGGDSTRMAMLVALMDGGALTAGDLAEAAGVTRSLLGLERTAAACRRVGRTSPVRRAHAPGMGASIRDWSDGLDHTARSVGADLALRRRSRRGWPDGVVVYSGASAASA